MGFIETKPNIFTHGRGKNIIIIDADIQKVIFPKSLCNKRYMNLLTHESFVVLECLIYLIKNGYKDISFNKNNIRIGSTKIQCLEWECFNIHIKPESLSTGFYYSSRLVGGLIERRFLDNTGKNEIFDTKYDLKSFNVNTSTNEFNIINSQLVKYVGNAKKIIIPNGVKSIGAESV
jgi:hypothetical protein